MQNKIPSIGGVWIFLELHILFFINPYNLKIPTIDIKLKNYLLGLINYQDFKKWGPGCNRVCVNKAFYG